MKTSIKQVVMFCLLILSLPVAGQDIIIKKNGDEVVGKLLAVSNDSVCYRMFADSNGPKLYLPKSEIAHLKMASSAEVQQLAPATTAYVDEAKDLNAIAGLRLKGKQDAMLYYKGRGAFWSSLGATLVYPPAGLLTSAVVATVPPGIQNDANPNAHLLKDETYRKAYMQQARKKKMGLAAAGLGTGAAVLSAVYMAVVMSVL
ncbi:hypothetical protein [Pontibacter vulgaris]|uniref:hypothetical protein n=1 Tax=Pontibacter vulgaris TaxID=2905679 RepID=UPI001FA6B634|nr:hypothetical protein [Pontibacter vulgaris]